MSIHIERSPVLRSSNNMLDENALRVRGSAKSQEDPGLAGREHDRVKAKVATLLKEAGVPEESPGASTLPESRKTRKEECKELCFEIWQYMRKRSWKKKALMVFSITLCILVFTDLLLWGNTQKWRMSFVAWMEHHVIAGIFAFIAIFIISTLVMIPPSLLTFGCGYFYASAVDLFPAIVAGVCACFVGSVVGAIISFYRARYLMRDLVRLFSKRYSIIRAVDRGISRKGLRVMFLLRLCPLIPFNSLNYIGGITGISVENFTFALVGILPAQIVMVVIGATAGNFVSDSKGMTTPDQRIAQVGIVYTSLGFAAVAVVMTYIFARKELQKELAEQNAAIQVELQASLKEAENSAYDNAGGNDADIETPSKDSEERIRWDCEEGIDDEEWFWIWA